MLHCVAGNWSHCRDSPKCPDLTCTFYAFKYKHNYTIPAWCQGENNTHFKLGFIPASLLLSAVCPQSHQAKQKTYPKYETLPKPGMERNPFHFWLHDVTEQEYFEVCTGVWHRDRWIRLCPTVPGHDRSKKETLFHNLVSKLGHVSIPSHCWVAYECFLCLFLHFSFWFWNNFF